MAQQVLEYNTNLVTTVVLTDPEGQDWANSKPYLDGESVSSSVQFWWYHMQGPRNTYSYAIKHYINLNYLNPPTSQNMRQPPHPTYVRI